MTASISVSALYLYPLKSCRGQSLASAELDARGIKHDRALMLVDADGQYVERNEHPRILLSEVIVRDTSLLLSAPGMEPLQVEYKLSGALVDVHLWANSCQAIDQGDAAAAWFSAYLGLSCRLVRMADTFMRPTNGHDQVNFVDGYPFLLLSEASLADLNSRLSVPISMQRFRPNIVLRGVAPYAEDQWQRIRIGECEFEFAEACVRCATTMIDPETAVMGKEPLRTLAAYRRGPDGGTLFGQYIIHRQQGIIHVGDPVEILATIPTYSFNSH